MAISFTIVTIDEAVTRPSNTLFAGHTACSLQSDKGYRSILAKHAFLYLIFRDIVVALSLTLFSFTQKPRWSVVSLLSLSLSFAQ
jgi:hypothetical protein